MEFYHFLFETMPGMVVLVGGVLVISIIISIIWEIHTRRMYQNHEPEEDDWFDDGSDEEEEPEEKDS